MKKGIFIQANSKQLLGAKIAKFAMETRGKAREHGIPVTIMNVEEHLTYMKYVGMTYRRGNETRVHNPDDLQFFTLSRFMPPELMGYDGLAVVIDPDIFALSDINALFKTDLQGAAIGACPKKDAWDTSVMLLDCSKLTHWSIEQLLEGLRNGTEDYRDWMQLRKESVVPLARIWNSLDELTEHTIMLHTTDRLTQPWKTGLPIDFTPGTIPKLFGILPRFWITQPTHYQKHPNPAIEKIFISIAKEALDSGAVHQEEIHQAIESGDVRNDMVALLKNI